MSAHLLLPLIPANIQGSLGLTATHGTVRGSSLLHPVSLLPFLRRAARLLCLRLVVRFPRVKRKELIPLVGRNCTFSSSMLSFSMRLLVHCKCVAFRTALSVHTATSVVKQGRGFRPLVCVGVVRAPTLYDFTLLFSGAGG